MRERSESRGRLAAAGASAIAVFIALYLPEREDGSGALLGAVFALAAVALGLTAIAGIRSVPGRTPSERMRVAALSLLVGIALGLFNLGSNYSIAALNPSIHAEMTAQWSDFSAWSVLFSDVVMEEIAYRLLLMGGAAWLISRGTRDRQRTFILALASSSLLFGVAHILPGSRPTIGVLHAVAVTAKSAIAGGVLGWVFWRKGLPYSMICHGTANGVHLVAWPLLF